MSFIKRFAWLIFPVAPTLLLFFAVVLAAVATGVLDHDILGRDAEGWPVLYKTPALRYAVDAFHMAVVYLLPPTLAAGFLAYGRKLGVRTLWILIGGVLVSAVGSVHIVEAVWTGVKGTSDLHIDLVDDPVIAAARFAANLAVYSVAFFYLKERPT